MSELQELAERMERLVRVRFAGERHELGDVESLILAFLSSPRLLLQHRPSGRDKRLRLTVCIGSGMYGQRR